MTDDVRRKNREIRREIKILRGEILNLRNLSDLEDEPSLHESLVDWNLRRIRNNLVRHANHISASLLRPVNHFRDHYVEQFLEPFEPVFQWLDDRLQNIGQGLIGLLDLMERVRHWLALRELAPGGFAAWDWVQIQLPRDGEWR